MDLMTMGFWGITFMLLLLSFMKDSVRTKAAIRKALQMGRGMALSILAVIFAIGLILAIVPPQQIASIVELQNPLMATLGAALFGTITLIPAFIAFPLIGTLLEAGVGIMPSVAFLTTLTMVGVITFPLEKKEFGTKFTLYRNGFSFVFAILIAVLMGVII